LRASSSRAGSLARTVRRARTYGRRLARFPCGGARSHNVHPCLDRCSRREPGGPRECGQAGRHSVSSRKRFRVMDSCAICRRRGSGGRPECGDFADPCEPRIPRGSCPRCRNRVKGDTQRMNNLRTFLLPDSVTGSTFDRVLGRQLVTAWREDGIFQVYVTIGQARTTQEALAVSRSFFPGRAGRRRHWSVISPTAGTSRPEKR